MKVVKHNGYVIEIYESIEDRPSYRHMNFNKNLMIETGIGSDLSSFDNKLARISNYISKDMKSEAIQEMENMRQNLQFVMSNISPKMIAFCYLIHSINGKKVGVMTDDKATSIIEGGLNKIKVGWFDEIIDSVKKKIRLSSHTTSQS